MAILSNAADSPLAVTCRIDINGKYYYTKMQREIHMKKTILIFALFLSSFNLFAENFLAGGYLKFDLGRSSDSTLDDHTNFTLELFFGRYIFESFAVGGKIGYYCTDFIHRAINIGAFNEYDFMRLQYFSLGIIPSVSYFYYHQTDDLLADHSHDFNRSSIELAAALQINLFLTKHIEIFTSFMNVRFQHQWWSRNDSEEESTYGRNVFNISGLSNLNLGVKFRF